MNIEEILKELDLLFVSGQMEKVEEFLDVKYNEAIATSDYGVALSILNEQIGYFRVTTQFDKALGVIDDIKELITKMNLTGTISEGTSLLNIATIYRTMNFYEEAKEYYVMVEKIYKNALDEDDYRNASLYNNLSLFYQEIKEYSNAVRCLKKALSIIEKMENSNIEIAVSHTNLGQVYTLMGNYDVAMSELTLAEEIFKKTNINDEHFCALANAFGFLYLKLSRYEKAVEYFEIALEKTYNTYGKTANFNDVKDHLLVAYKLNGNQTYSSMLDVCEAFYDKYGKPMIREKFKKYEDKIAVGLCGEGSECLGIEDDISIDHDCGPGFAMWVSDEVYSEIGEELNKEYEKLPSVFAGYIRSTTAYGDKRCGVCKIDDYFERILGFSNVPSNEEERKEFNWFNIDEALLTTATSGRVFRDDSGEFTTKRNMLKKYYPKNVWIDKLSRELIYAAQTGQYNYQRSMARQDYVTASLCLNEYMKSIMHVVFLLNKEYMPYYKWQHKMVKKLEVLPEIGSILEAICDMPSQREAWKDYQYNGGYNANDMIAETIEIIAKLVVDELKKEGLSTTDDPYLEIQGKEVYNNMNNLDERNELIENIVKLEWKEFDQVLNEGGRAECQDNFEVFSIMRKSQYMTWNDDMLNEYLWYINEEYKKGRNIISEKYGRMMESTAPEKYEEVKHAFPELSDKRKQLMESIIDIQVKWMEEFAEKYPHVASTARSIHTSEDSEYNTSYETYLRGELGTYSEEMIGMYGRFVVGLLDENKNLAYMTMENTVKLYGYESLDVAEKRIK